MAIQGLRDTSNFIADARPKDWLEGVMVERPNGMYPLAALSSLMKKRTVTDPEYNFFYKQLDDRRFTLATGFAAAAAGSISSLSFASGSNCKTLKDGDILYVEQTQEHLLVHGDPASDTAVNVVRGFGGTSADIAAVNVTTSGVNPNLLVIGSSYEEGSLAPTGVAYDPTKEYNYTQIFRRTLEATRTAMKTKLRTGDDVAEARRECLEYFMIDLERAYWLGERVETTRNGKPQHTMRGIVRAVATGAPQNIYTPTSTNLGLSTGAGTYDIQPVNGVNLEIFEEILRRAFQFGSQQKMGICGDLALLTIQQIVRKNTSWQFKTGEKEFGMDISRVYCPFGSLTLKTHPLWNQNAGGLTGAIRYYGMNSWLAILDMEYLTAVTFNGMPITYERDLGQNGMDGMKSGYKAELSLQLRFPRAFTIIKGLAKAKADS